MTGNSDQGRESPEQARQMYREAVEETSSVYIIAEAGVNHNGDMELAKDLVDAAVESGADAVKFQTFRAERLVTADAAQAAYQEDRTETESQYEMLERYELEPAQHEQLQEYCRDRDIAFLSTPFDAESADLLDDLDVPLIKLGSGELNNHPLLEHVAAFGRPMIVSTGMGTLEEVREAASVIRDVDPTADVAFLHCTSAYPAETDEVNLQAMAAIESVVEGPVGYSDHTTAVEMPGFAVAAGADIVEKHFTLDSSLPGPDHSMSLEPDELDRAVSLARAAATARGAPEKQPTDAELDNRQHIRKSLHAETQIRAGESFDPENVTVVRPADGLTPPMYDAVLGSEAVSELQPGDPITVDDIEEDIQ